MFNDSASSVHTVAPLTAVSYVRVSTAAQATRGGTRDGYSIPAQREANKRRAHSLGALVVAEFVERGASARSADRPELKRMLDYVAQRPIDYVIVHKLDRLARDRADDVHITGLLRGSGTRLASSTEAISDSPDGRLVHGIMASIAEFYSHNLATEVRKGMRQKVLQGGSVGRAPLGYLNHRYRDDQGRDVRTVVVDPDRGPHITWAFQTYATGTWSMSRLASGLNDRGMTTKAGPNTPARPLSLRSVHHLLRNPYYKGVVVFHGAEHPGSHAALVDSVTWAAVQDILTTRRNGERSRVHDHYLKGTVYCIECGRRLIIQHTRTKSGRVYEYFVCHRSSADCAQRKALPIAQVEQRIADSYRDITLTADQRSHIERITLAGLRRRQAVNTQRLAALIEEADTIEARRGKLLDLHYADAVPRDLFREEQQRLSGEKTRIERERTTIETDLDALEQQTRDALDLLQDVHETYEQATEAIRKQLNQAIFNRVILGAEPHQIRLELNEPYSGLLESDNAETD